VHAVWFLGSGPAIPETEASEVTSLTWLTRGLVVLTITGGFGWQSVPVRVAYEEKPTLLLTLVSRGSVVLCR